MAAPPLAHVREQGVHSGEDARPAPTTEDAADAAAAAAAAI